MEQAQNYKNHTRIAPMFHIRVSSSHCAFASDAEMPALVREVLAGTLATSKDIKLRIKDWQGDFLRA